jgi:hypothetical protein
VFGPTVFSGVLSPTMTPFSTRQNFGSPSQSWKRTAAGRRRTAAAAAGRRGWPAAAAALASSACFAAPRLARPRGRGAGRQALAVEDVLEAGPILERDRRDNRAAASAPPHCPVPRRLLTTRGAPAAGCAVPAALARLLRSSIRLRRDGGGQCHGQHSLHLFSFSSEGLATRTL